MTHGVEVPGPLRVDVAQSRPGAEDARLVTRVVRVKVSIRSMSSLFRNVPFFTSLEVSPFF